MEKPKKEGALYVHQKKSKKKTYFCEDCGVGLLCGALLLNLPQPAVAIWQNSWYIYEHIMNKYNLLLIEHFIIAFIQFAQA